MGVGVSTGGPKRLMSILPKISASFKGSILIAQHMPEKFTLSFANRLNKICNLEVKEAEDGDIVANGKIYIAPGGKHMRISNRSNKVLLIEIIEEDLAKIYKPSVDILFESLNKSLGNRWLGVILTGMGSDGALELTRLRKNGGHTIAESEETCVVYGMPGKAVKLGGAEFILNDYEIADKIIEVAGSM